MEKKRRFHIASFCRRAAALLAAAITFRLAMITAGSNTMSAAASALQQRLSPLSVLRWELADPWDSQPLSAMTMVAIGQSPYLLSARKDVARFWSSEVPEISQPELPEISDPPVVTTPVTETPLDVGLDFTDNGIPAKTLVPTGDSGYTVTGSVYISNTTSYSLAQQELTAACDAVLTDKEPQILIIHTHGSESYTPPEGTDIVYSGDHRTTDSRYNVVHVGDEMAQVFADAGIAVIHDRTMHDYPSYSGAYDRSLAAINHYLEQYPSLQFILDVHRDAIEDTEGNEYKVVSLIDGKGPAAQLTLVVGSDGSGAEHPDWLENLKLAVSLQAAVLKDYPTLMRPMLLRNSRYNQHATTGSLLLEVGAAGNSPDEAVLAARLFAQTMVTTLQNQDEENSGGQ